jgi:release factor glutamine methyltransferase
VKRTIGAAIDDAAAALQAAGLDDVRRRARRLIAVALRLSPAEVFARPERILVGAECGRIDDTLRRLVAQEPLSRIDGRREFWGLEFLLSSDALDPRPETETVVEAVLMRRSDRDLPHRILDLGTGSGCLLLALLAEFRCAYGVGIDIVPGAIATARENARRLDLGVRSGFAVGDWGAAIAGEFDVIVANPPYIATGAIAALPAEVRVYDPLTALDGGADGLAAYRVIAADVPRLLRPEGLFAVEIGVDQDAAVAAILAGAGLRIDAVTTDLSGIPRCIIVVR